MPKIFSISREEMRDKLAKDLADPNRPNRQVLFVAAKRGKNPAGETGEKEIRVLCAGNRMGWAVKKHLVLLLDRAKDDSPRIDRKRRSAVMTAIRKTEGNLEGPRISKKGFELAQDFGFSDRCVFSVPLYAACEIMGIVEKDWQDHRLERKLSETIAATFSDSWGSRNSRTDQMDRDTRLDLMEKTVEILRECGSREEMESALDKAWVIEHWIDDPGSGECQYGCGDMDVDLYGFRRGMTESRDDYIDCIEEEPDDSYAGDREIMGMNPFGDEIDFPFGQTFVCERKSVSDMLEKAGLNPEAIINKAMKGKEKEKQAASPKM